MQPDHLKEDNLSREQALTIDSFIVEAPAGAGKTELLTQRFLKLLSLVEAPEEIIAITFTNKAASEMKMRVMDSLAMAANSELPTLAHKQITFQLGQTVLERSANLDWQLLETPSRLRIYTIDSLSANLARQMPLLSRFGTQPGVRDDATMYYEAAATRAIEHLDNADYGDVVRDALRFFDNDIFKLTQLLADMLSRRDQWLSYTHSDNTAADAEKALASMISADLQQVAKALPISLQTNLMPIARYAASNLPADNTITQLLDWQMPLEATIESLRTWQAVADLLLTTTGTFRKSLNKNLGLPATNESKPHKEALLSLIGDLQQDNQAEQALASLRILPQPHQDTDTWHVIATLAQLLHIAVGELWLVFQAHGEVDFVEVANRALLALEDPTGNTTDLAMRLDYRIQHLLVDEFQDTSPSQIKLIKALTNGWQADDGRTLFCVGDPMQSIYRFRKANVGLFLDVAKQGIGQLRLKSLKLWRNNRSTPAIVDWVNHAFTTVFPKQDSITRSAIAYRPFVATKTHKAASGVTIHPLLNDKNSASQHEYDESDLPTDTRQTEADRIIEIIQQTREDKPDATIAVLVRARSHLKTLVTEIRRNHPQLSFQAVEIEELANRQVVQDLLSLTYALHQRADRVHWLAVLRAPWCGLTLADLHTLIADDQHSTLMQLMQDNSRLTKLSENGLIRLQHVRTVFTQALAHQGRMRISRWLHGVWLMLGGADCLWDAGDVRDVQAFFDRVHALEMSGQFSPQHLAEEVKKLYASPDVRADGQLQFMTIHKSKGLEFDTVILPGLDHKKRPEEQPLLLWEEVATQTTKDIRLVVAPYTPKGQQDGSVTPYDYLKQLEKERSEYEAARVLYVAATRAERCLHLLGAANLDAKGNINATKNTFLAMLWPVVSYAFTEDKFIQPKQKNLSISETDLSDFSSQLIRLTNTTIPAVLAEQPNATTINNLNEDLSENSDTLDTDIGTLVHFYLQLIADQNVNLWTADRIPALEKPIYRWFKQRHYNETQSNKAAAHTIACLQTTLNSDQGRWALKHRNQAASELAIEVSLNGIRSKKIIDRTFVENGTRWIIDYKSTVFHNDTSEIQLLAVARQYQTQLDDYEKLFIDEGLPIKKAIFFASIGKLIQI